MARWKYDTIWFWWVGDGVGGLDDVGAPTGDGQTHSVQAKLRIPTYTVQIPTYTANAMVTVWYTHAAITPSRLQLRSLSMAVPPFGWTVWAGVYKIFNFWSRIPPMMAGWMKLTKELTRTM